MRLLKLSPRLGTTVLVQVLLIAVFVTNIAFYGACNGQESPDGGDTVSDTADVSGDGTGGGCRSNVECTVAGEECLNRDQPQVCGVPPQELCDLMVDCSGGECHAIADSCSWDGVGSQCGEACTADEECGQDFRCGAGGACEAVLCNEGFVCPAWQVCDPSAIAGGAFVHERHHGCVIVTCTDDGGCAGGLVCVNGYCQTGLGTCGERMAVP